MARAAQTPAASPRVAALDGLRGIAVLSVILYHAFQLAQPATSAGAAHPARWIFGAGRLGVDLFFVLSGFLLIDSWEATRARHRLDGRGRRSWRAFADFLRRRARRVGPAYWMSLVILVPVVAPELFRSLHGLGDLALLATFQQYLDPHLPARVNVVYWSLTTEVHFYLLLPVLAYALRRFGRTRTLCACLLVSLAWRVGLKGDLPASWITGRVDEFVAGMVAAGLVADFRAGRHRRAFAFLAQRRTAVMLAASLGALALANGAATVPELSRLRVLSQPVIGLLIAALVTRSFTVGHVRLLEHRALQFLGATSYSLYLWHRPILVAGAHALHTPIQAVTTMSVLIVVAVAVSAASYLLIERPFLSRGRPAAAKHAVRQPETPWLVATAAR